MNQTHDPLADQPLGQKLVKKSFWLYFFTAIILPTGYLVRIMISQSLSVEEVGLLYTIIGFVGMLSSYNDLGLTGALIYFIPKLWIEKRKSEIVGLISLASLVQVITTIGISCFLWFGGEWLATHYFHNTDAAILLRRFVWYFVGINIFQVVTTVFKSLQDVIRDKVVEAVKMWATVIFCVWVLWGSGMPSLVGFGTARVAGMLTATGVGLMLFGTRYGRELMMRPTRTHTLNSDFGHYALYTFLAMNAGVLLGQVDQQMVNYFLGNEMAGYYTNFLSLTMLATLMLSPLSGLMYPLFTELFAKNDTDGVRRLIELYYHELLLLLMSTSAFLFVFGPEITTLLFGEEWRFSGELLMWYMPFLWINFIVGIHFTILSAQGHASTSARIVWLGLIINTIANYLAMQLRGIYGAIFGLILSSFAMWFASATKLHLHQMISIKHTFWLQNLLILLGLMGLSWITKNLVETHIGLMIVYGIFWVTIIGIVNFRGFTRIIPSQVQQRNKT